MSRSDQDETLLVMLVQRGDVAAFEKLLRRLHASLRQYVTRMAGAADADDVLQEVALRIFRKVHLLREPTVFRPWVFRIATRISFAYLKREKRWRDLENDPELIRAITADPPEHEKLDCTFLELIDCVSPASRAALLLHYEQHLSLEETAAILDVPVGTVKSRISYGLATIRNSLKENKKP
jgi:RNA polymerase sigma-70 factor, ECF subfamily